MGEFKNWMDAIGNVIKSGGTTTSDSRHSRRDSHRPSRDKSNRGRHSSKKDDDDDYPLWQQSQD
jgi:hypothetical protein